MKKLLVLLSSLLLLISFTGCSEKKDETVVKIGVVGEYFGYWQPVIDKMKEEGVTVELVKFSEYIIPNQALASGDIDMNAFQHYAYLEQEITNAGYKLEVLGETIIAPLALYSEKVKDVKEIKEGDSIAIPNDATNRGRSLKLLEDAGLITVDPTVGYLGEVKDITSNPLNLQLKEVDAALLASLLPDVTASIINGGNAVTYGLNPIKDSIFIEKVNLSENPNANRIINVLVVREEDLKNEVYLKILENFQTEEVAEKMEELYGGAFIPAWK